MRLEKYFLQNGAFSRPTEIKHWATGRGGFWPRGLKGWIINYWFSFWKIRAPQMWGGEVKWPPSPRLSLAVMHFCLIDCLDAGYCFLLPFCFGGGATPPPHPSFVTTRTQLAFSFTQQEPSGGSFDGNNSHWRSRGGLIGLHLCIGTIMLHSRLLMRNEWEGKKRMCGGHTAKMNVLHVPCAVCMPECQHGGTL